MRFTLALLGSVATINAAEIPRRSLEDQDFDGGGGGGGNRKLAWNTKPRWSKPTWSAPAWDGWNWSKPTKHPVSPWSGWNNWGPPPTKKPTNHPVDSWWGSSWGGEGASTDWVLNGWNEDAWGNNDAWAGSGWWGWGGKLTPPPTALPSKAPTSPPSVAPTTAAPTQEPTKVTPAPTTSSPTKAPTTPSPTPKGATPEPTNAPTARPTTSSPTKSPTPRPTSTPSPTPKGATSEPSSQPSAQPSALPSSQPSSQPSSEPSSQPSSEPSSQPSAQPSALPSSQPSNQPSPPIVTRAPISMSFPGGELPQCDDPSKDPCLCGTCQPDGTCNFTGKAGDGRPDAVCFQPTDFGGNDVNCAKGDILNVTFSPDEDCTPGFLEVELDNEPSVCPGGWFFSKDKLSGCKQAFVNNYFLEASCVNSGAPSQVHASCSQQINLCSEWCGFLLVGYSILDQQDATWYFAAENSGQQYTCSTITSGDNSGGSCSSNFPTPSPTPYQCPIPSAGGGTDPPGTECAKDMGDYTCSNCCSDQSSFCDKPNGRKICGLNTNPDQSACNAATPSPTVSEAPTAAALGSDNSPDGNPNYEASSEPTPSVPVRPEGRCLEACSSLQECQQMCLQVSKNFGWTADEQDDLTMPHAGCFTTGERCFYGNFEGGDFEGGGGYEADEIFEEGRRKRLCCDDLVE